MRDLLRRPALYARDPGEFRLPSLRGVFFATKQSIPRMDCFAALAMTDKKGCFTTLTAATLCLLDPTNKSRYVGGNVKSATTPHKARDDDLVEKCESKQLAFSSHVPSNIFCEYELIAV